MISHYFTLEALAAEFRKDFAGATVVESFTQSKNELILTIETAAGEERSLLIGVAPGMNAVFHRDGRMRAKKNSTDIFPEIFGLRVTGLRVDPFSRVLTIALGGTSLKAHLFNNSSSNVFLLGPDGALLSAFSGGAGFAGRPYELPSNRAGFPDPFDAGRLGGLLAAREDSLKPAVKKLFPWLGPPYVREALFRAGLEETAQARDGADASAVALAAAVRGMLGETVEPGGWLYAAPGFDREILSAVGLGHLAEQRTRAVASVNDGVREIFSSRRRETGIELEKSELLEAAERERRKVERSLGEAKTRAEDSTAAGRYRETGTLILTHLNAIRKGETEARLTDGTGAEVAVRLDRSLTPAGNANAYFDKARKAEKAREENETRIGVLTAKLAAIAGFLEEVERCDDVRQIREIRKRLRPGRGAPVELQGGERLPYRVFPIGEQYEAWVGKSSSDNDLLTFKHAGQHDYWMHVRGASGSHVVLRSRSGGRFDPPKEVIRTAARLAAYYSKMKKAGMVPVAYCERKYVKKPKNAPPGTVTLQREEVIFVEPALP